MEHRHLGRSGLKVSPLCLGTMNFGPQTTEQDGFAIMDKALALGINFFDTADVYGWEQGEGRTEQILGRWFAQGGERREHVVLATKVYGRMYRKDRPDPNLDGGLSARKIIQCCDHRRSSCGAGALRLRPGAATDGGQGLSVVRGSTPGTGGGGPVAGDACPGRDGGDDTSRRGLREG